jgi:hypothetical protein
MKPRALLLPFALFALSASVRAQCPSYPSSIAPKNGASGIRFGDSVDLDDGALFVGSPFDDEGPTGIEAGSVQALPRLSNGSFQSGWRLAPTTVAGDHFGCSVAVSGTDGVAGAEGDDKSGVDSGAVYLMHRVLVFNKATWVMGAKLKATPLQAGARLGASVDMAPGVAVAGAPGADKVYVFEDNGSGFWTQTAVLSGFGDFGAAVATNGLMTIVGAPTASSAEGCDTGLVWVYERVNTSSPWFLSQALAPDCIDDAEFGASVSLDLPWLAVGTPGDRAVHAFTQNGSGFFGTPTILSGAGAAAGPFGTSVSLQADTLLVGEPGASLVHIFDCNAGFAPELQVGPSGTSCGSGCEFGAAVATHSGRAVAGAPTADRVYSFLNHNLCETYCAAGTSASGCQAQITATGTPSASAASGFALSASAVEGDKDGLFYFGANGRIANVWGNGTSFQCVLPPVTRAGFQSGTGTPGVCDGAFLQDLNALWCPTCPSPQKNPGAGAIVQAQLWYRDPQNTSNQTTSLSAATEFTVQP